MYPMNLHKETSFNVRDCYKDLALEEIKRISESLSLPYSVALANITGDLNTGNIVRTSSIFAAEKVFVFGKRKWDRRSAFGSNNYVPVEAHYADIDPFDWEHVLHTIRINGYYPVIIEQYGLPLSEYKHGLHKMKPCLIFGAEDVGVPKEICDAEECFSIPQFGVLRSLNVASAAAIVIHHVATTIANDK